jgi:hypothetical protein
VLDLGGPLHSSAVPELTKVVVGLDGTGVIPRGPDEAGVMKILVRTMARHASTAHHGWLEERDPLNSSIARLVLVLAGIRGVVLGVEHTKTFLELLHEEVTNQGISSSACVAFTAMISHLLPLLLERLSQEDREIVCDLVASLAEESGERGMPEHGYSYVTLKNLAGVDDRRATQERVTLMTSEAVVVYRKQSTMGELAGALRLLHAEWPRLTVPSAIEGVMTTEDLMKTLFYMVCLLGDQAAYVARQWRYTARRQRLVEHLTARLSPELAVLTLQHVAIVGNRLCSEMCMRLQDRVRPRLSRVKQFSSVFSLYRNMMETIVGENGAPLEGLDRLWELPDVLNSWPLVLPRGEDEVFCAALSLLAAAVKAAGNRATPFMQRAVDLGVKWVGFGVEKQRGDLLRAACHLLAAASTVEPDKAVELFVALATACVTVDEAVVVEMADAMETFNLDGEEVDPSPAAEQAHQVVENGAALRWYCQAELGCAAITLKEALGGACSDKFANDLLSQWTTEEVQQRSRIYSSGEAQPHEELEEDEAQDVEDVGRVLALMPNRIPSP